MATWTGKWRVNSAFEHSYGQTGEATVEASSQADAEHKIQLEGAMKAIGSPMRWNIMGVSDVKQVKKY